MSLPINPGCLARVTAVSCRITGQIVRVVGLAGPPGYEGFNPESGQRWEIDALVEWTAGNETGWCNHIGEKYLQRIDDDSRQITSWESMKDIWSPKEAIA